MNKDELSNARSKLFDIDSTVRGKSLRLHYNFLIQAAYDKAIHDSIINLNPFAREDAEQLRRAQTIYYPSALLFVLCPNLKSHDIYNKDSLSALSHWTGIPLPEAPVFLDIQKSQAELRTLKPYTPVRIVSNFPSLRVLFDIQEVPLTHHPRIHKKIPTLLGICTTYLTFNP